LNSGARDTSATSIGKVRQWTATARRPGWTPTSKLAHLRARADPRPLLRGCRLPLPPLRRTGRRRRRRRRIVVGRVRRRGHLITRRPGHLRRPLCPDRGRRRHRRRFRLEQVSPPARRSRRAHLRHCFLMRFDDEGRCRDFTEFYVRRPSRDPTDSASLDSLPPVSSPGRTDPVEHPRHLPCPLAPTGTVRRPHRRLSSSSAIETGNGERDRMVTPGPSPSWHASGMEHCLELVDTS